MNDDTAEYFQVAYDKCVYRHGPDSPQAKEAEAQAKQFFTNKRERGAAPVSFDTSPLQTFPFSQL